MFVTLKKYRELEKERDAWRDSKKLVVANLHNLQKKYYQLEACKLPMLTKKEAECLLSCLNFFLTRGFVNCCEFHRKPQFLKKLTDKGYLERVKRGEYKLTFVK